MIFASNNKGKINEIKSIFQEEEIISLKEANVEIEALKCFARLPISSSASYVTTACKLPLDNSFVAFSISVNVNFGLTSTFTFKQSSFSPRFKAKIL